MRWPESSLFFPIAAGIAVGVWPIVRGRYCLAVACAFLGFVAASLAPFIQSYAQTGWQLAIQTPPAQLVMTCVLTSGATAVALATLWAGYSRGYWFWRALLPAVILAALALLEANEPIVLSLAVMPLIAIGAWGFRWRQDREAPGRAVQERCRRWRWTLRDALLGFVIVGLVAVAMRSLSQAEMYLVPFDLLVTSQTMVALSLVAFYSGVWKTTTIRCIGLLATIGIGGCSIMVHSRLGCDALGLATFYEASNVQQNRILHFSLGSAGMATVITWTSFLYATAVRTDSRAWQSSAQVLVGTTLAVVLAPVILVIPRMLPPSVTVKPLPPSPTYAKVQAAGQKATGLRTTPNFNGAPIVKEAVAALAEPGNVWFDARQFRELELSGDFDRSFHRDEMLSSLLDSETAAAEQAGRSSEVLELSLLQWRLGRVLRRGGIAMNLSVGWRAEKLGRAAISGIIGELSDDECQLALTEARESLNSRPDIERVLAYDAYWHWTWFGWRNELFCAALSLVGENPHRGRVTEEGLRKVDTHGLARWRLLETRLAIELYRREHDAWPETLADLIPTYLNEIPSDPFSDRPLVYRRDGVSFVLYSVGKDGRDDGGVFPADGDPDRNFQNGDIDWECEHRGQANSSPRKLIP